MVSESLEKIVRQEPNQRKVYQSTQNSIHYFVYQINSKVSSLDHFHFWEVCVFGFKCFTLSVISIMTRIL
jgi:hypothetical protein